MNSKYFIMFKIINFVLVKWQARRFYNARALTTCMKQACEVLFAIG